jgi:predicted dithiol-disulfide oxidoreductase (DUF899 family)
MPDNKKNVLTAKIANLEKEILKKKKELRDVRRQMPDEPVEDTTFRMQDGSEARLSDLFGGRDELILIHNMGKKCPYCTMWADGFNGLRQHLENRAAVILASPDDPATQKEFADSRDWQLTMCSYGDPEFVRKLEFLKGADEYYPGVSAFRKTKDGKIFRTGWTYFGPGDDFCSAWHLFDLLPERSEGWQPKYAY